jgi:hypothetical protein
LAVTRNRTRPQWHPPSIVLCITAASRFVAVLSTEFDASFAWRFLPGPFYVYNG